MNASPSYLLAASVLCGLVPACVNVIAHDQKAAARAATEFARVAFVDHDDAKAYALMSTAAQAYFKADQVAATLAAMHPKLRPTQVSATDYEPLPGQKGMLIYLKGTGGGEDFFYRLTVEGDATTGYRVNGLFRGNGPHPSTKKRPLK